MTKIFNKLAAFPKFSAMTAIKIYMWTLKYFPDETEVLKRFISIIQFNNNYLHAFHRGVFTQKNLNFEPIILRDLLTETI